MSMKMNPFDLSGKVALVTGGNGGIGLGMAHGLAKAGASIAVAARNAEKSAKAVAELQAHGVVAEAFEFDATSSASIKTMVADVTARMDRIDILVNNAGTNIRKPVQDLADEEWHQVIDTNLSSAFMCSKAVYPVMRDAGSGKILNNGSMLSIFGSPWGSAYAASKGGMVQLTKSMATGWAGDNIQVNCFLPGWIDTELTIQARKDVPELHEKILNRTPAGRWGTIEDMAGVAVFLASPASDFVTGTAIPVDGGFSVAI
jgi:2-dehydro-3-deoxy-D-gluconate 5-dehydrogenase